MNYGVFEDAEFTLEQDYDVEYTMDLNTKMDGEGQVFTINGKNILKSSFNILLIVFKNLRQFNCLIVIYEFDSLQTKLGTVTLNF